MTNWVDNYFEQNPEAARLRVVARSRYSLHLRRSGRQRLALISAAPMHYFSSANREWLPIDTRLRLLGDGRLGAPGLPFIISMDGSVAVEGQKTESLRHRTWRIGLIANGEFRETQRLGPARLAVDRMVREAKSMCHEVILHPAGLREELILLEAPKTNVGSGGLFAMESLLPARGIPAGLLAEHTADGLHFPRGWAQDASGRRVPVLRWVDQSGTRLYSGIPLDWLADASYPVVIDPDINITGETADGYIEGSTTSTSTTFDSSGVSVSVGGRNEGGTPKVWRGYVKFNTSSLGPASTAERVNLQMYPSAINDYVAWTIHVRQYDWSANDPMASGTREAAWDGLGTTANAGILATSADPAGTPVVSQDLPTAWVQLEGNTYYGLWCDQEGYSYPTNQGGQHQYSSANHTTPNQRPLLRVEYLGSYPLSGSVPLRSSLAAPRVLLPDTRVILRSRTRRTSLTAADFN